MKRSETLHISEVLRQYLAEEPDVHEHLLEQRALELLPTLLGSLQRYIVKAELSDAVLTLSIQSAAVRQMISQQREPLRQRLNQLVEAELIREVRVY